MDSQALYCRVAAAIVAAAVCVAGVDANPLTKDGYATHSKTKGVVLLDIDWGRYWGCGGNDNAQLRELGFDLLPLSTDAPGTPSTVLLQGAYVALFDKKGLQNHALLLEPGEYALTSYSIRIARSAQDVGHWRVARSDSIKDGKPAVGSFRVAAGEVVFIGNFKLECSPPMTLWRYYTEGKAGFAKHLQEYRANYPFLDLEQVQYRLFDTQTIGRPYELK